MRGEGNEEVPSIAAPPLPMAVRRRDFRRERVRSGPNDMVQDSVPDCAWRSGMEHATVLKGERKVCPIDDSKNACSQARLDLWLDFWPVAFHNRHTSAKSSV